MIYNNTQPLYRFVKASERLPEPFKVCTCKFTPPSPDPRQDTELHWGFVDKSGKWTGGWKNNEVEWLEEIPFPTTTEDIEAEAKELYPILTSNENMKAPWYDQNQLNEKGREGYVLGVQTQRARKGTGEKETAISFLDSIRDYERENGGRICFDERTSEELYDIFQSNIKLSSPVTTETPETNTLESANEWFKTFSHPEHKPGTIAYTVAAIEAYHQFKAQQQVDQRGIMNELINWLWEEDNIPDGHAVIKKASELLSQQPEIQKVDLHGFLLWNKDQFAPWIPMEEKDRWIRNAAFKDSEEKTTVEVYETYLKSISKQ